MAANVRWPGKYWDQFAERSYQSGAGIPEGRAAPFVVGEAAALAPSGFVREEGPCDGWAAEERGSVEIELERSRIADTRQSPAQAASWGRLRTRLALPRTEGRIRSSQKTFAWADRPWDRRRRGASSAYQPTGDDRFSFFSHSSSGRK
jgi:hypothetical protein